MFQSLSLSFPICVLIAKEEQLLQNTIEDIKTKITLLQEKKMRVDDECETVRSETKEVHPSL